jgi:hypothetical protein
MSTTTKRAKQNAREREFICIDPDLGTQVYDYYNNALPDHEARQFEAHLLLCFRCQEIVFELDEISDAIKANRERLFGPDKESKPGSGSKRKRRR